MKGAADILQEAARIVGGDREKTHGDKARNFAAIAAVWNGVLEARRINGRPDMLDGHDVATLMEAMKIARRYSGAFNADDYVDGAGYAGCAFECAVRAAEDAVLDWPAWKPEHC